MTTLCAHPLRGRRPLGLPGLSDLSSAILAASASLLALCAPAAGAAAAASAAAAPAFERAPESASPLKFEISSQRTSRVAIEDRRIESAVFSQDEAEIKTDERTGQLYVLPKIEGPISIYLTTDAGETAALLLEARADAAPQNLLLRRRAAPASARVGEDARQPARLPPMPAADYEEALKRFAKAAALGAELPDVMKRSVCPAPSASLEAALERLKRLEPAVTECWASQTMAASVIRVRNRSLMPAAIREPALIGPTVLAVAAEKAELGPGERGSLIFIEAAPEGRPGLESREGLDAAGRSAFDL